MIRSFEGIQPALGQEVFVAETALVLGDVVLGDAASIWYGTVVRGDVNYIRIGRATNIQDRCVIHVSSDTHPTNIGDEVTVGHGAILHGCTIGAGSLVGMGAIVLDGVELGESSLVAAGSLLPPGKIYPPGQLIMGSPAKARRPLRADELQQLRDSAAHYVELARRYGA